MIVPTVKGISKGGNAPGFGNGNVTMGMPANIGPSRDLMISVIAVSEQGGSGPYSSFGDRTITSVPANHGINTRVIETWRTAPYTNNQAVITVPWSSHSVVTHVSWLHIVFDGSTMTDTHTFVGASNSQSTSNPIGLPALEIPWFGVRTGIPWWMAVTTFVSLSNLGHLPDDPVTAYHAGIQLIDSYNGNTLYPYPYIDVGMMTHDGRTSIMTGSRKIKHLTSFSSTTHTIAGPSLPAFQMQGIQTLTGATTLIGI
jgi:hypothetical protein